jgi:hypothetical protein
MSIISSFIKPLISPAARRIKNFGSYELIVPPRNPTPHIKRTVPAHIPLPEYVKGHPPILTEIIFNSEKDLQGIAASSQIAKSVLQKACDYAKAGSSTLDLDAYVHELIIAGVCV